MSIPSPGYTVSSVVSAERERIYVAGAPRFNHTGKVILFSMHGDRNITIRQALQGEQVIPAGIPPGKNPPSPRGGWSFCSSCQGWGSRTGAAGFVFGFGVY